MKRMHFNNCFLFFSIICYEEIVLLARLALKFHFLNLNLIKKLYKNKKKMKILFLVEKSIMTTYLSTPNTYEKESNRTI